VDCCHVVHGRHDDDVWERVMHYFEWTMREHDRTLLSLENAYFWFCLLCLFRRNFGICQC